MKNFKFIIYFIFSGFLISLYGNEEINIEAYNQQAYVMSEHQKFQMNINYIFNACLLVIGIIGLIKSDNVWYGLNGHKYAGFWRRAGAMMIDGFIFIFPFTIINTQITEYSYINYTTSNILMSILFTFYIVLMHSLFGATIGKFVTGIRVTKVDGTKIGFKEAIFRSSIDILFSIPFIISIFVIASQINFDELNVLVKLKQYSYLAELKPKWAIAIEVFSHAYVLSEVLVILFNKKKRSIHDFIAGTVVIHKVSSEHCIQVSTENQKQEIPELGKPKKSKVLPIAFTILGIIILFSLISDYLPRILELLSV
jgi:uncharacterized RDD family membrane protein YckC